MTMKRRSRAGFARKSRRPRYRWGRFSLTAGSLLAPAGSETIVVLMNASNDHEGHTLERVIMQVRLTSGVNDAGTFSYAMGMVMWVDEASSNPPDPGSDAAPWMYLYKDGMTTLTGISLGESRRYDIDVRTRRKLTQQSELIFVFEAVANSFALNIDLQGRFLERIG